MLANTLSLTIAGETVVFTRVNQDNFSSEYLYKASDEELTLKFRHSRVTKSKVPVDRHNIELRQTIFSTPTTDEITRMTYCVIENSSRDLDTTLAMGLLSYLVASSGALLTSLSKWES